MFLRTTLGGSHIAEIVRHLNVTYAEGRCAHEDSDSDHSRCVCPQPRLRQMVRASFAARSSMDSRWILEANRASEPALVGVLITALPQLLMLELNFIKTSTHSSGEQDEKKREGQAHADPRKLFGDNSFGHSRRKGRDGRARQEPPM
jgi:hypothetical protein